MSYRKGWPKVVQNGIKNFPKCQITCNVWKFWHPFSLTISDSIRDKKFHTLPFSLRVLLVRNIVFIVDETLALPQERQASASMPRRSYVRETATAVSFSNLLCTTLIACRDKDPGQIVSTNHFRTYLNSLNCDPARGFLACTISPQSPFIQDT